MWQDTKTQDVTIQKLTMLQLKNSKCDNLKFHQTQKLNVTKLRKIKIWQLKNSKSDKLKKTKIWQN